MELKGRITIYSIVGCPHCMAAKHTLHKRNLPFTDVSVDKFPDLRQKIRERTQRNTVPQIFFNERHIGGNSEFQGIVKNEEEFNKLIEFVRDNEPGPDAPKLPEGSPTSGSGSEIFVCEPDEYAVLVRELRHSGIIKDHRKGLKTVKNSYSGKEFVDWVVEKKGVDRERAVEIGQELINHHFGHDTKKREEFHDDEHTLYRLLDDDETKALNAGDMSECTPQKAAVLGEQMRQLILKIYADHLSDDGKKVDYKAIGKSDEFTQYVKLTKELQRVDVAHITREEKLSFFINIYNALVIHANITVGPPVNLWQRYKFFNTVRYIIGGLSYSLQDIENGVLRANQKGVGMLFHPFSKSDPRLKVALEKTESLIHFALVCGAKSCPPIKTYSAENIDKELHLAVRAFLESDDGCMVNMEKKEVALSQIFKWYKSDFAGNNEELAVWVHDKMDRGEKKTKLGELIDEKHFKVTFMPYDWSSNTK